LFGSDLLVAPIYDSTGTRTVVFPPGNWVDFWTHTVIVGPRTYQVGVPLDRVPLFVRANALLPTMNPVERLTDAPWDAVVFDAYLLERGRTTLRDTDGKTDVSAALEESRLRVELSGASDCGSFQ